MRNTRTSCTGCGEELWTSGEVRGLCGVCRHGDAPTADEGSGMFDSQEEGDDDEPQ